MGSTKLPVLSSLTQERQSTAVTEASLRAQLEGPGAAQFNQQRRNLFNASDPNADYPGINMLYALSFGNINDGSSDLPEGVAKVSRPAFALETSYRDTVGAWTGSACGENELNLAFSINDAKSENWDQFGSAIYVQDNQKRDEFILAQDVGSKLSVQLSAAEAGAFAVKPGGCDVPNIMEEYRNFQPEIAREIGPAARVDQVILAYRVAMKLPLPANVAERVGDLAHKAKSTGGSGFVASSCMPMHQEDYGSGTLYSGERALISVENIVLEYLNRSSLVTMKVKVPVTYYLDLNAYRGIAVQQDFRHSTDIASIIRSIELSCLWMRSKALSTSQEIGHWLRCFHEWASEPQQADFRSKIGCNEPMQMLKHKVTNGAFIDILKSFPKILQGNIGFLKKIKERADLELLELISGNEGPDQGMIHGDCWMGNVLLSKYPPAPIGRDTATDIIFIDWEMCQLGPRAYDLGHMIGDRFEAYHFHNSDIALTIIRGFIEGYGEIDDDMAFRTAIHAGVQFLGWYNRRAPSDPVKGTTEQISSAAKISTSFIVKGWERER
ncbi:hypothetical protein FGADI_1211 [Fusarium gaditjirri]|uniref:Aminoglycoside phosphotransferase domain-containing protein n=1 Tax=Fusarium gaditjirri TaxID=282569 RepID=A0A8H4TLP5_9HYPO|nr:hypothetical protein FGADI_1211 [Fusarium gaditjirri]